MTKKGRQKFWAVEWNLFPKKRSLKIFRPPKLCAKSPPMPSITEIVAVKLESQGFGYTSVTK